MARCCAARGGPHRARGPPPRALRPGPVAAAAATSRAAGAAGRPGGRAAAPGTWRAGAAAGGAVGAGGEGEGLPPRGPVVETIETGRYRSWEPPRWLWRTVVGGLLLGQVVLKLATGKVHLRNTHDQLQIVGPRSMGVCLLTASFVGMVFTIQFIREFTKLGLTQSVGGVLALAMARELSPVVSSIIIAGRIGSAFAAELGTMQVSEQIDSLRMLQSDPVDYLVVPRVLSCVIALPLLSLVSFSLSMGASTFLADGVYDVAANVILDSAAKALDSWDIVSMLLKSMAFGGVIAVVSCTYGLTTKGGAKGVGESTTNAVVVSLVSIFVIDFVLSFLFFHGAGGDALKAAMA